MNESTQSTHAALVLSRATATNRRLVFLVCSVLTSLFVLGTILFLFALHAGHTGFDFNQRLNEIDCVLTGIDPADIWSGRIESPDFRPFDKPASLYASSAKPVNGYSPWEYSFMFPFAVIPRTLAGVVWYCFEIAVFVFAFTGLFVHARTEWHGVAIPMLFATTAFFSVGSVSNTLYQEHFGLPMVLCALGMVWALNRRKEILAGILWSLIMVKPNVGVLFFFPLAIGRRYLTIAVAVVVCLAAMIPPSILVGKPPFVLIAETLEHGKAAVSGTTLLPGPAFDLLSSLTSSTATSAFSAIVGAVLCFCLCWKIRTRNNWLIRLAPAALLSTAWSYSMLCDELVGGLANLWVLTIILDAEPWNQRKTAGVLFLLTSLASVPLFFHSGWNPLLFMRTDLNCMSRAAEKCVYGGFCIFNLLRIGLFTMIVWSDKTRHPNIDHGVVERDNP